MNAKTRLGWVRLYEETGDFGLVCRRCGISRPTLRKWWRRYLTEGEDGLINKSRRPNKTPKLKVTSEYEELILTLRKKRNMGARRIQFELIRHHRFKLSTSTIWKILKRNNVSPLRRLRTPEEPKRYSAMIPGERIQMDTMKVAKGLYQYTAIDDCTRVRVLGIYSRRTAKNSTHFLVERVVEEFPFPIQRIQTDRGGEFFGLVFQKVMRKYVIKFRPIRPRSPHLNGKVERSQMTDKIEFYPLVNLKTDPVEDLIEEWQFDYNWHRPHSSLGGKTPMEKVSKLSPITPYHADVDKLYNPEKEHFQERNYKLEMQTRKLKRC